MSETIFDQAFGSLILFFGYLLSSPVSILVWIIICPIPTLLFWYFRCEFLRYKISKNKSQVVIVVGWVLSTIMTIGLYLIAWVCAISLGMWG